MPFVRDRKPDPLKRWVQIAAAISSAGGILIGGVGVGVGIWQFSRTQSEDARKFRETTDANARNLASAQAADAEKLRQTQTVEAARPFLEKKLKWCEEATEMASAIANSPIATRPQSEQRFSQLYWGVMGMIEEQTVTTAMVRFRNQLIVDSRRKTPLVVNRFGTPLQNRALDIAHACADEMAKDWSPKWKR
ncbi:hypothetical protein SAMN05414139_01489 [Burkholderia sp. D7]|nr:hypothetical protein SAMN05414139_01489 [Burkholderia sp. D7]